MWLTNYWCFHPGGTPLNNPPKDFCPLLRGYSTPRPYFGRLCVFSQKIKQLCRKYPMDLIRNVTCKNHILLVTKGTSILFAVMVYFLRNYLVCAATLALKPTRKGLNHLGDPILTSLAVILMKRIMWRGNRRY